MAPVAGPETQSAQGREQRNRRKHRRVVAPVFCRPAGVEFFARHIEPMDISLGGMRIRSDEPHRLGVLLLLDVFFLRLAPVTFTAAVMWTEALHAGDKGRFDVGLAFIDPNAAGMRLLLRVMASEGESHDDPPSEVRRVAPEFARSTKP
jgi:PilZ domain